jgi:hypothetical protein
MVPCLPYIDCLILDYLSKFNQDNGARRKRQRSVSMNNRDLKMSISIHLPIYVCIDYSIGKTIIQNHSEREG